MTLPNEGKSHIIAQTTVNREMKYLGTKQYVLPERWEYGKTLGLSRDDKRINLVLDIAAYDHAKIAKKREILT